MLKCVVYVSRYETLKVMSEAGNVDERELAPLVVKAAEKKGLMEASIEFAKTVIAGAKRRKKTKEDQLLC